MGNKEENDYDRFLHTHRIQLSFSDVPERFWPTLYSKLKNETFDAGNYFSMVCQMDDDESSGNESIDGNGLSEPLAKRSSLETGDDVHAYIRSPGSFCEGLGNRNYASGEKWKVVISSENGLDANDPECIFLIDHAWTYLANEARQHLLHNQSLLSRMCSLMDVDEDERSHEEKVQLVLKRMWLHNQTYSIQRPDLPVEEKMPIWYIMDEFGSRVGHNDQPNVRFVPFYYVPQSISYTVMFPTKNIEAGDSVTRDFVEGALYHRPEWRPFYLLPWTPSDYSLLPFDFIAHEDKFFTDGRNDEKLLDFPIPISSSGSKELKVYSECAKVREFLKHARFKIVESKEEADVLWLYDHFKQYKSLIEQRPSVLINQIPFESVLTVKDLLSAMVHAWYHKRAMSSGDSPMFDPVTLESLPKWFASTYNLRTELPQFISYFQNRDKAGLDNHWIIKPWNLARGLDITVTADLNHIIRLIGSGPKIACKYIEDPVLFYRDDISEWVKFDMRYIVMVRSVRPMRVYIYNHFWLRFALKEFSMDSLDDYEKHFTVFNYLDASKIKQMFSNDFVNQFQGQYPQCQWNVVQENINSSLKELLEIACNENPPKGLAPYPQCRAMYGADVMLKWSLNDKGEKIIQPVILEVNFMPDCGRACDYYPDFMNAVFETLFLDESSHNSPVTLL